MIDRIKDFASHFFVTGDPLIYGADVSIGLTTLAILFVLFYFKKWGWLWREWLTTVDHKKIGIMYLICFASDAVPGRRRCAADAYTARCCLMCIFCRRIIITHIFTTHGTIMILFMAMPMMFGLFNMVVPLQIGASDVAYPFLNQLSFWLFFFGAMLFNISFVIGGSPDAGWLSYPPLSELSHSPGVGQELLYLGHSDFRDRLLGNGDQLYRNDSENARTRHENDENAVVHLVRIFQHASSIIFAFPILTVTLALLFIDRFMGGHFFTMDGGGNPMMYVNLIWMWGHPEVYIVVLPAFGIFSEIVSTFSRKRIFGYKSMVFALMSISVLSFFTWVHHFFTMGSGADVNVAFALATMAIGIPTGAKVFNWLFTMFRGRIRMEQPMLWTLAFIPCFVVGGTTGVMLAVAPADFNSITATS